MATYSALTKFQRLENLETHMRQMVNARDFNDVVFLCNDGVQVRAHRMILAGSSEVLRLMLSNGMMESRLSEIKVLYFSSTTLLTVFEFLYTRTKPVDYCPHNQWSAACDVMEAARFFLLPELESLMRTALQDQIFDTASRAASTKDPKELASLLTESLEYDGLDNETKDQLLWELVKRLASYSSRLDHIPNLSEDAFNYLLVKSKVTYEDGTVSMREYCRFKQIMYWWVCQSDIGSHPREEVEELVDHIVPTWKKVKSLYENQDHDNTGDSEIKIVASLSSEWRSSQLDVKLRNSAMRLLSNINCRLIRPLLLLKVLQPLKIIPVETIQDSFQFHAIQRKLGKYTTAHLCWDHSDSFKISQKGRLIERAAENVGLAVMESSLCEERKWGFEVQELCEDFTELGLFYYSSEECAKHPNFHGQSLSHQEGAKVLKFRGSKAYASVEGPAGQINWKLLKYEKAQSGGYLSGAFEYDAFKHTCSLSLNGKKFDSIWETLPNRFCYPAVSFGYSLKGRVRFWC